MERSFHPHLVASTKLMQRNHPMIQCIETRLHACAVPNFSQLSRSFCRGMAAAVRYYDPPSHPLSLPEMAEACSELVNYCCVPLLQSPTPYTGTSGLAYALWRSGSLLGRDDWKNTAAKLVQSALSSVESRPGRFVEEALLDGVAGVLLVNCLVTSSVGPPAAAGADPIKQPQQQQQLLSRYADICRDAASSSSRASDEFLYGRAGTLFGALLLHEQLGQQAVPTDAVQALVDAILRSGRSLAAQYPVFGSSGCPLAYLWPPGSSPEPYLGAAHGLMGILYVLLHCRPLLTETDLSDVRASLQFVLSCESASLPGHFPTLMQLQGVDTGDRSTLVHWCHGAPGAVFLFSKAYEELGDKSYLSAATRAGQLVWRKGLLKKGPGLCHGVAGNAYALLKLWKVTQDACWLQRGLQFAAFILSSQGRADWQVPDNPASLYEGAAGAICLMAELHRCQQQQPAMYSQVAATGGAEPLLASVAEVAAVGAAGHARDAAAGGGAAAGGDCGEGHQPGAGAVDVKIAFPLFELLL